MTRIARTTITAGLLLAAAEIISTQSIAAPPPDPKACEPGAMSRVDPPSAKPPGTADAGKTGPSTTGSGQNENLSDKLARSDGVLCPPNVDPGIHTPPPGGGRTPVIPPPGSPGGDPSVQPK
jgi:hypothetical protein